MDIEALRRAYIARLNAKTRLGHRLWVIRERAIASGLVLLDQEGIAREAAQRRGGVKWLMSKGSKLLIAAYIVTEN